MERLASVSHLTADSTGWGFFLCVHKSVRPTRRGESFLAMTLQDQTGQIDARLFDDVERYRDEFDEGDFVKVQGRGNQHQGRLQFIVDSIRRVNPEQDRAQGFSEEQCVPSAPRPIDDMWAELEGVIDGIRDPSVKRLVRHLVDRHRAELRVWPAARIVHHAYRGGFLEHVLKVSEIGSVLAEAYSADRDLVVAGALLHDIGKLQELHYDHVATYSREGNLVGHIALGLMMVRDAIRTIPDFPASMATQIEHLIVSHHGAKAFGSPVEPMTIEAFILAMADDLDAKINQVRQAIVRDDGEGEFTAYQSRLGRALWKGVERGSEK